jgi:hypothetical protein
MSTEVLDRPEADHDHHCDHGHHRDTVAVIDTVDAPLHRGRYELATLKKLGKVPESDDLLQLVETKLLKLSPDKHVEICGGEIFVSCPHSGGSS